MDFRNIILFSDMDDTLLNDNKQISEENLRAIQQFKKKGGLFTIATGRSARSVKKYIHQLDIDMPVILYNGCCIYDYGRRCAVWKEKYTENTIRFLSDIISAFPRLGVQFMAEQNSYCCHPTPVYEKSMMKEDLTYQIIEGVEEIPEEWIKIELIYDLVDEIELIQYLEQNIPQGCRWLLTGNFTIDIVMQCVSKGNAVKRYMDIFALQGKTICCIGDHNNDFEMLQKADISFTVENALKEIKDKVDFIVQSNNHHALANVINLLAGISE